MTEDQIEPCPYCGAEAKCSYLTPDKIVGWTRCTNSECQAGGPLKAEGAEAVNTHNAVALAVRLMPEAVELFDSMQAMSFDWHAKVDAWLTEARGGQTEGGEEA